MSVVPGYPPHHRRPRPTGAVVIPFPVPPGRGGPRIPTGPGVDRALALPGRRPSCRPPLGAPRVRPGPVPGARGRPAARRRPGAPLRLTRRGRVVVAVAGVVLATMLLTAVAVLLPWG